MNGLLVIAGLLAISIGIAHTILGERYILMRLFRRGNIPQLFGSDVFTKQTLRFAWHLTSVAWWGFAALLVYLATEQLVPATANIVSMIAIMFLITAAIAFVSSRGRHLAWIVFLAIAIFAWFGIA